MNIEELTPPPGWSLAFGNVGTGTVILAALAFLASAIFSYRNNTGRAKTLFYVGSGAMTAAFLILAALFVTKQFQFAYVFRHSASALPLGYRIAGVWSGQEGSFLLWGVCSALFGVLTLGRTGSYQRWYGLVYALFLGSLAGISAYESPFSLVETLNGQLLTPPDGNGLPPALLNYWVIIHPPTIFFGFGSLAVCFSYAMAALISGDMKQWIDQVRPWAIASLTFLGVGLCMGGFWAYETLNWGGFWMWDPVENTSFVPWAILAAFIHGIFVQKAKGTWHITNAALAAGPFLAFLYGTFMTRSGFLADSSVHSFAEMERGALWILIGIVATAWVAGISMPVYRSRKGFESQSKPTTDGFWNKHAFYGLAIWLLLGMAAITAIGMSVPLIQSLAGQQPKIVEEKLYHQVLSWPYPFVAIAIAVAPFLSWNKTPKATLWSRLTNPLALTVGTFGFLLLWLKWAGTERIVGNLQFAFSGILPEPGKTINLFGNVEVPQVAWVLGLTIITLFGFWANVAKLASYGKSVASIGGVLTHAGVMLAMAGLIFSRGLEQVVELTVNPATPEQAHGYVLELDGRSSEYNDYRNKIVMNVSNDRTSFQARPGLYFQRDANGQPMPVQVPGIHSTWLYDLYFVVYPFTFEGSDPTNPTILQKGTAARFKTIQLTYDGYEMIGEAGMAGTRFVATVHWEDLTSGETGTVKPEMAITGDGPPEQRPVAIEGTAYTVRLSRIDPATGDGGLDVGYQSEAYPLQVFYKPLTRLVWAGVGIMGLGGFMAAASRRIRRTPKAEVGQDSDRD